MSDAKRNDETLLRPDEAARRLAISERSLWQLTKDEEIPCIRLGRSVRYSADDLRDVIRRLSSGRKARMQTKLEGK